MIMRSKFRSDPKHLNLSTSGSTKKQAMEDTICDKKTMENCIEGSLEDGKGDAKCESSSVWGIQRAKNAFVSVFGGLFRLKSGAEVLPTNACEPTSPNQLNGSVQKPTEEAPPGDQVKGSGAFQKTEEKKEDMDKILSEITSAEATGKGGLKEGLHTTAEDRKMIVANRNQDDLHQFLVPEREEKVVQNENDIFLEKLYFYHGYLPQMECRVFIRRGGDFLVRKWEDEGEDFTVISVGIPLAYTKDGTEDLDENYGKDEPVIIKDHIIRRKEKGYFIDFEICFDSLEWLLAYYLLNPDKKSLDIKLERPCPRRYFQYRGNEIERKKTVFLGEVNCLGIHGMNVAVKMLRKDCPNAFELGEKMLDEARHLLILDHEHVIEIYGWAIDKKPFMVLMEFMEGGSLDSFLIENFEGSNNSRLLKFALEAAKAVAYLHEMDVLHRDVSARNCLLASDLTLKLSGFGFATSGILHFMRTAEKLPTRYLSPETLSIFVFVQVSDCFGFGNLLYEIFSGGMMPYEELKSAEAREKILNGEINNLEETRAPPALRNFVEMNLWAYLMVDRTDMDKTVEFLEALYKECKKIEKAPKTDTEASIEKEGVEPTKKDGSTKLRRRKPVSRAELLEDICPTQEETTAQNE
ncbi:unnamed protein product [Caenorhabditis auriculariae]|uniref:Non-specific protein-tyrosine kinase n=1 Tax=Caenorhabditis auriculariae TaxID=2777116 RepID=A0A8S1GQR6_9PELO|nr:unnamed protein product [Caenorhabditis auriculariae]